MTRLETPQGPRAASHCPSPSEPTAQHHVIGLDHQSETLALWEALCLCRSLLSHQISPVLRQGLHQTALRLTYVLLRRPVPQCPRDQLLALHRSHQQALASSLCRLQDRLHALSRETL